MRERAACGWASAEGREEAAASARAESRGPGSRREAEGGEKGAGLSQLQADGGRDHSPGTAQANGPKPGTSCG